MRSAVAGLAMGVAGLAFILLLFALSRIVVAQFDGPPDDGDELTAESWWFFRLFTWGMIPVAVAGVGALVSALVALATARDRMPRWLSLGTLAVLVAGVPFAWQAFVTWAGSGW